MQIRLHDMSLSESFPCTCIIIITHSELYVNFANFIQHVIHLRSRAFEGKFIMSFMIKGIINSNCFPIPKNISQFSEIF